MGRYDTLKNFANTDGHAPALVGGDATGPGNPASLRTVGLAGDGQIKIGPTKDKNYSNHFEMPATGNEGNVRFARASDSPGDGEGHQYINGVIFHYTNGPLEGKSVTVRSNVNSDPPDPKTGDYPTVKSTIMSDKKLTPEEAELVKRDAAAILKNPTMLENAARDEASGRAPSAWSLNQYKDSAGKFSASIGGADVAVAPTTSMPAQPKSDGATPHVTGVPKATLDNMDKNFRQQVKKIDGAVPPSMRPKFQPAAP